jgi:hypothetical protein
MAHFLRLKRIWRLSRTVARIEQYIPRYLARQLSPCHDLTVTRGIPNHHMPSTYTTLVASTIPFTSASDSPQIDTKS